MKLFFKTFSIVLLTFLLLSPGAFAVTVKNWEFDFSSGAFNEHSDYGTWYSGDITDWNHEGDADWGIWAPTSSQYNMSDVDGNIGYLNGGFISQNTGHSIAVNNVFTLSVDIGNRFEVAFPYYEVRLMAYGTEEDDTSLLAFASSSDLTPGKGDFSPLTLAYTALAGDDNLNKLLGIEIFSKGAQLNFDNVRLSNDSIHQNAVPEPTTMLLLGTGLLGLAGFGRKKFFKK